MPLKYVNPVETQAWRELTLHRDVMGDVEMRSLFATDPSRAKVFSLHLGNDLMLDYSKQRIVRSTMRYLCNLAEECGLHDAITAMFNGDLINDTEQRAVLHVALRAPAETRIMLGDVNVVDEVQAVLAQMRDFCTKVRDGIWLGFSGKPITDVVNIGIGGSYLGPEVVCEALKPYATLKTHFVSNVDAADMVRVLRQVNAETTLFLIASKTFTTQETMTNAQTAKAWFLANGGSDTTVARHFVAMSTNREKVAAFGIDPVNMFPFWDWVGGRFSLWSSIGLSIALSVGFERFSELLEGAHLMDEHFRATNITDNMPVVLALLSIWNGNFLSAASECVLPYDQTLQRLPAFLQQLLMESNGKSITRHGKPVKWQTGQIIWGEPGTNGQHAFYQLIHQGTQLIPADFIVSAKSHYEVSRHHLILAANCFAQAEALMLGQDREETREQLERSGLHGYALERILPHRVFKGNHPSNTILLRELTPKTLGMLLALYEHKTFVQGVVWNIFSFDQWGVELGKKLSDIILSQLGRKSDDINVTHDASTAQLMEIFLNMRQKQED